MLRGLARISFIRRVNGADNSQRAHVSLSGKLKSGAAAAIPRSRSPQRSGGKYSPVRAETNSLRLDNNESGRVACMVFSGSFQCAVFQRMGQEIFFFQRKK